MILFSIYFVNCFNFFSYIFFDDDNPNLKKVAIPKRNTSNKETNVAKTVSVQNDKKGTSGSQSTKGVVKSKQDSNWSYGELFPCPCQFCIYYQTTLFSWYKSTKKSC